MMASIALWARDNWRIVRVVGMAVVAGVRAETKDPREQLNRLFNITITDQEVGTWLITDDLFASEFATQRRPGDPATCGRIIREAVWRLIEAHNQEYLKRPAKATCTYETCAARADLQQWHVLALLFSWEPDQGITKLATIDELCDLSDLAATWHGRQRRELPGQSARKRGGPPGPQYDDLVLRQGLRKTWFKKAKRQALDGLYAHLCDPDDPIITSVLRERTDPPLAYVATGAPTWEVMTSTTIPNAPVDEPLTDAPHLFPGDIPPPFPWDSTLPPGGGSDSATPTLPGTTRLPWLPVSWRRWLSIVVAFAILFACVSIPGTPPFVSTLTWKGAGLSGWVIARQGIAREPPIFAVVSLQSGDWRALWPPQNVIDGETSISQPLPGTNSLTAPVFTAVGNRIAYIAKDSNQVAAIYETTLVIDKDGWPAFAGTGPRMLAECSCGTLAWTPGGQWLIYNSPGGLMAVTNDGAHTRSLTTNGRDGWPACSPDGRYLAYQRDQHGIVAIPTTDCLPDARASQQMRFLNGYTPAWNPSWSPDGQTLSFVSNAAGHSAVYVVPFIGFVDHLQVLARDTAQKLSGFGCANAVWAQRSGYAGIAGSPAIVFGCDQPTPTDHHGTLGASSGPSWPRWSASLSEGIVNRDSLCWIPANLHI